MVYEGVGGAVQATLLKHLAPGGRLLQVCPGEAFCLLTGPNKPQGCAAGTEVNSWCGYYAWLGNPLFTARPAVGRLHFGVPPRPGLSHPRHSQPAAVTPGPCMRTQPCHLQRQWKQQ